MIAKKSIADIVNLNYLKEQGRLKTLRGKSNLFLYLLNMKPLRDMVKRVKGSRMGRGYLKRNVLMWQTFSIKMLRQAILL